MVASLVAVLSGTAALASDDDRDEERDYSDRIFKPVELQPDEREFRNFCASCHGRDGKGSGFLTRVFRGVDPGDLTLLSASNGGEFPLERVFSVIDGRTEVAAHGDRRMPVWGDRYMSVGMSDHGPDELNEMRVKNRIYALVHYLQALQRSPDDEDRAEDQ
jgi:mono/diheme cytochrome c family protein